MDLSFGHRLAIWIAIIYNAKIALCYEFDAENALILDTGFRYHLCNIPTAASYLGQIMSPNIFFSLSQGGTIDIDISIDSYKTYNNNKVSRFIDYKDTPPKMESTIFSYDYDNFDKITDKKELNRPLIHPSLINHPKSNKHDLYSKWWSWFQSDDYTYPGDPITNGSFIPNTYLIVMNYFQWTNYINSNMEDLIQPANNDVGYIFHPHLTCILKIPILNTNERVKTLIRVEDLDRYVVFIYNPEKHLLTLSGKVYYSNDGETDIAKIRQSNDLYYVDNVVLLFAILNLLAAIAYGLILFRFTATPKMVHYFFTINFLLCSLYMFIDYINFNMIKTSNYNSMGLYYTSNIFMKIQEVFNLFILVVLALGWQVLRQSLTHVEHQVIIFVCIASLYLGILEVMLYNTALSRFVIHAVVFVIILMAINFNWAIINSRIGDELVGMEAAKLYHQLNSYRRYRQVFGLFLMKPAIITAFKHIALRPVFSQIFVWDQHLFIFINLSFSFAIDVIIAYLFYPFSPKGLLTQIPN